MERQTNKLDNSKLYGINETKRLILLSVVLNRVVRQPSRGMAQRSNLKIPIRKFLFSLSTVSRKEYRVKGSINLTR
ncbi:MAG: hypothetical protein IJ491_08905, partial [Clostridia bacterium]|nr:hypothetical protein [Clostridia bacterium]